MNVQDMFLVGNIMEWEDKDKGIQALSADDCHITGKQLNKSKIIFHMKREGDGSEGNVFVRLKDEYKDQFLLSKRLFASRKIIGMSLNELKNLDVEQL